MINQTGLPKISVITVSWNAAGKIGPTAKSVVSQDYPNLEYIVIDGASSDSTLAELEPFKSKIATLVSEKDKGIYNAMNKSLQYVTGDYVYFLGAGDTLATNSVFSDLFAQAQNEDIILGAVNVIDGDGKFIYIQQHPWIKSRSALLQNFVSHQATFIKTELLKTSEFDESFRICADYEQILKLVLGRHASIGYYPVVIANYPTDGVSSATSPERVAKVNAEFARARSRYYKFWEHLLYNPRFPLKKYLKVGFKIKRALANGATAWLVVPMWCYWKLRRALGSLSMSKSAQQKVLVVAEATPGGGTGTYLKNLIDYYRTKDYGVSLMLEPQLAASAEFLAWLDQPELKVFTWATANRVSRFLSNFLWFYKVWSVDHQIMRAAAASHADIIVVSASTNGKFIESLALPLPTLYIQHTAPDGFLGHWYKLLVSWNLSARKRIATVSKHTAEAIKRQWRLAANTAVEVIYNAVPALTSAKDRVVFDASKTELTVLTAGSVEHYKAPDFWLETAKQWQQKYPDIELRFIWAGRGSMLPYCRYYSQDYKQIEFIGQQSSAQLDELYAQADIYWQPSRHESFGLSVLEAMNKAIPVVVSNVGGLPEVVADSGIVTQVDDAASAINALHQLALDANKRQQLGLHGQQRVLAQFSSEQWQIVMDKAHAALK